MNQPIPDAFARRSLPILGGSIGVVIACFGATAWGFLSPDFMRRNPEGAIWICVPSVFALPVLAAALFGLVARRFAIGAWWAPTFLVAAAVPGFAAVTAAFLFRDGIGPSILILFGSPLFYLGTLIVSAVTLRRWKSPS